MAGRIINFNRNQINIADWLQFHPYEKPANYDYYYLRLCKEIQGIILSGKHKTFSGYFDNEEINSLACFMVSYFEDIITGTGIWQAFTKEHKALYGKYLPFYQVDEYYPKEINCEDVFFLLWYFVSSLYYEEKTFLPVSGNIIQLGVEVFQVFEREYEFAPENIKLREFLNVSLEENDYYKLRYKIEWLVMDSYLFHFNRIWSDAEILELIEDKDGDGIIGRNMDMFVYEIRDLYINNKTSPLLALRGKDWLAGIVGKNHELYKDIRNLSLKKTGFFLFQKEDENYLYFQHIATDTIIPVTKISLKSNSEFREGETIVLISFVKWKDDWWFTGTYSIYTYNANLILDEKNSVASRALFSDIDRQKEVLKLQYNAFLDLNKNSLLVFLQDKDSLNTFMKTFNKFYNKSLNLSKKERGKAKERVNKKGYFGDENKFIEDIKEFDDIPSIIFFNQKSGIEIIFGFNEIIPDPKNPEYNPDVDPANALNLLYSDDFSAEFINFIIEKYDLSGMKFPGEAEDPILKDNLDFMLRFLKRDNYFSKPQVTLI